MNLDLFIEGFKRDAKKAALVWQDKTYSYGWLLQEIRSFRQKFTEIPLGAVVELHADFSPCAIAILFVLIEKGCIIVPTTKSVIARREIFQTIAEVEYVIEIDYNDHCACAKLQNKVKHKLLCALRKSNSSGLILFSSGSTGVPKAVVHDFGVLLEKFRDLRPPKRIITFLLFDHIGGINTLFHTLSTGGCVITLGSRTPDDVCRAIMQHHAAVLPTSPTFINLLLLSAAYQNYDLSSLELVTYGTEPMPESTLHKFNDAFPDIRLTQTYGLSELGILRAKSKSSDSLYLKIGGEGYDVRIVDNMLEIKAKAAMLGYLNAESPFTEDGWFKTGDLVEVDGEYIKILGRQSEIINVGGEKVYPAEIESVIHMMENVLDVVVSGESHPIMGQIVKAHITHREEEDLPSFRVKLREFCKDKLPAYKIPQKIVLTKDFLHNERFKRMRKEVK